MLWAAGCRAGGWRISGAAAQRHERERERERSRSGLVALKSTGSWPRCPASSALSSRSSKHSALPLRHAPHCTTAANPAAVQPRQARRRRTGAAATRPTCGGSSPVLPPTSAHTPALARRRDARTAVRRASRRGAATLPRPQQGGLAQRHHLEHQSQTGLCIIRASSVESGEHTAVNQYWNSVSFRFTY